MVTPKLSAMTEVRTHGRIKGLEEAKDVVRVTVRDQNLARVLLVSIDVRIAELRLSICVKPARA